MFNSAGGVDIFQAILASLSSLVAIFFALFGIHTKFFCISVSFCKAGCETTSFFSEDFGASLVRPAILEKKVTSAYATAGIRLTKIFIVIVLNLIKNISCPSILKQRIGEWRIIVGEYRINGTRTGVRLINISWSLPNPGIVESSPFPSSKASKLLANEIVLFGVIGIQQHGAMLAFFVRILFFDGENLCPEAFPLKGFEQCWHFLKRRESLSYFCSFF